MVWYMLGFVVFIGICVAVDYKIRHRMHPTCVKCGTILTEDNTIPQDDDGDICSKCYDARPGTPGYYEYFYEDR